MENCKRKRGNMTQEMQNIENESNVIKKEQDDNRFVEGKGNFTTVDNRKTEIGEEE